METFLPNLEQSYKIVFFFFISVLIIGTFITRLKNGSFSVFLSWLLFFLGGGATLYFVLFERNGFRMLVLIPMLLLCMKVIVTCTTYKDQTKKLALHKWLVFALGWFGMRPKLFETLGKGSLSEALKLIFDGFLRVVIGFSLLLLSRFVANLGNSEHLKFLYTVLTFAGLSFILHFGILTISAGVWRCFGINTQKLFKEPLKSRSLAEFWSKRWNIAFSEMTSIAVYRPLVVNLGRKCALVTSFLFSGFLHELAITVPAGAGFGLPTIYFLLQAIAIIIEGEIKRLSIFKNQFIAKLWVFSWLILPIQLLFPPEFIRVIIWPIIGVH
ncbi:hypothetical protein C3K47_00185 [Solitalea longa]|uniref:Wax synthase domain-containing protein n=1 Tax=Solitalea longa TaxID=2079460 RepID=A0A2S5A9M7_9SPHI|nr:MBOAT family protein [Solitalea longa]POY38957.1 hypothetical protein C3K47_00185 [Solitalea longa]